MADLTAYVWVRRKLYGPGSPPPPELWSELPVEVWDEPPSIATPEEQSPTGNGGGEAEAEPPTGTPGAAQAGAGGDAPAAPDFAWLNGEVTPADLELEGLTAREAQLKELEALPDDLGDLLAFAELYDVAVHGEHTDAAALRAAIRMVLDPSPAP